MNTMRWAEITIDAEPQAIDAVGNALNEVGCGGFAVNEAPNVPGGVTGYLPVDDRLEDRLLTLKESLALLAGFGVTGAGTDLTIRHIEEADWATAWKAFFKPMNVGRRLVVTPPWEHPELTSEQIPLIIDPGMAFGTGSHPTTQLCLVALEDYLKPGDKVVDIGTGSGILAIAASKLGAGYVAANDIDTLAVSIAIENAKVNGVSIGIAVSLPPGPCDLVVANILADVIIDMSPTLAELVRPNGHLIASGIIDTREDDVRREVVAKGFTFLEVRRSAEWVALIFQRK